MSDGLSDYWAARMRETQDIIRDYPFVTNSYYHRPIVPRITEYGRLMYAGDLGLPLNQTPAYFWLGRDAEASDAGIR